MPDGHVLRQSTPIPFTTPMLNNEKGLRPCYEFLLKKPRGDETPYDSHTSRMIVVRNSLRYRPCRADVLRSIEKIPPVLNFDKGNPVRLKVPRSR